METRRLRSRGVPRSDDGWARAVGRADLPYLVAQSPPTMRAPPRNFPRGFSSLQAPTGLGSSSEEEQTTRFLGPFPKDVERRTATWAHARRSTHGTGFRSTYRAAVTDGPSVPSHGDTPRSDGTTRMHSVLLFSRESAVRRVTSSLVPCGSFERSDPSRIREETVCENVRSFTRLHSC